jgi:hypothetical protein
MAKWFAGQHVELKRIKRKNSYSSLALCFDCLLNFVLSFSILGLKGKSARKSA